MAVARLPSSWDARAGQGRAGPGRAGPGRAGQGQAGQGRAGCHVQRQNQSISEPSHSDL